LQVKTVEAALTRPTFQLAWRSDNQGKALHWFVEKLKQRDTQAYLLSCR